MTFRLLPTSDKPIIDKDVDASLRYGIDVVGLLQEGDSVASATVSDAQGVTAGAAFFIGSIVGCRVSAGTAGTVGSVTLRWTTAQGDTDERTLRFNVRQR